MKTIHEIFNDVRLNGICVFCGSFGDTRDHVPSKALLAKPYPNDLPVVPACKSCNKSFSVDEEYVSCFIDCVMSGSTECNSSINDRTRRAFERNKNLQTAIKLCQLNYNGQIFWKVNEKRFNNVVLKLARGHAVYENSEPQLENPSYISFNTFPLMKENEITEFETLWERKNLWCELGSRGFIKEVTGVDGWQIVQPNTYRYNVFHINGSLVVQFVLREFIACEVCW